MKKIKHAQFLRSIETEGATTAEVEFAWEGDFGADVKDEKYIAVLKKEGQDGDFAVDRIVKKNADYEIDWFDNPMHEAFEDVTDKVLHSGGQDASADMPDRESFVRAVMAHEGVCEDMAYQQGIFK